MLKPPCAFGHEGAGEVIAVGAGVDSFKKGDRVVAANSAPCGSCRPCSRGRHSLCDDLVFWNGAFAESYAVPARVVEKNVLKLERVAPEDAAMTEPLACCVKGIEDAEVRARDSVLVIGAGSIGLMLVRLCVLRGATVTAAARRPEALERAREHGAQATRLIRAGDAGLVLEGEAARPYDVVFDAGGAAETASLAMRSASRGGVVNLFAGCPADTRVEIDVTRVHYEEIRILGSFHHTPATFRQAFRLIQSGDVRPRKFITGVRPLSELAADLMRPAAGALKTLVTF
jgi:L-iditol 2-dehydrogenase